MPNGILQPGDVIPEALSWENFELTFFGAQVIKFSSFEFDFKSEFAVNTGKGGEGVSWSIKSYKREAKSTVDLEEMKRLITLASAFGGDVLKLPAAPAVAKATVPGTGIFTLTIPALKIISGNFSFKQGSERQETPLGFGIISYPVLSFA
jgi:hypothetical protein